MRTIPLLISLRTNFSLALVDFTFKQAKSPATANSQGFLETWIDLICTLLKFFNLSGPSKQVSFNLAIPFLTIPDRIIPTPSTTKHSLTLNSNGWCFNYSMVGIFTFNFEMKSIRILNPFLLTLDTGKIGQIVAVGICSAVFSSSIFVVFYSLMRMGNLLSSLLFNIFLISVIVYSYLFSGAKSIFVTITKNGIFKNKQSPICYLVILDKPIFAPTTTHPKSGARPVSPLMVVFKYFSWPHRSTMEIILALSLTTSFQYLFLFWLNLSGIICLPYSLKPIIYWAIELVLPVSCSCL